jgi:hypothetical protein
VAALVVVQAPPSKPDIQRAQDYFAEAGFEVEPPVAISFSIAGPSSLFARVFPGFDPARVGESEQELSLDALPREVRGVVGTVVVEAPPEYGPGNP